jgi:hypothetical protein
LIMRKVSDADLMASIKAIGIRKTARKFNIDVRGVNRRREYLEKILGQQIATPHVLSTRKASPHSGRVEIEVRNGIVLVGGDGHYWPGKPSTAHRAFVKFCRDFRPAAVIYNGDAFDGATVSRHPSIGWENRPSVVEELEAVQTRLGEIVAACPRSTKKVWTLGNHDMRFETRLATVAPEYARINGFHLKDHFDHCWQPGWSCLINGNVMVKHRDRGGTHATHNNTLNAGLTMVTNHLHSGKVTPLSDYNGTRYGVDTGTLADPDGPQFEYAEDKAKNHRSGFGVLTFLDGQLLQPELVYVWDDRRVQFRGELIRV